MLADLWGGFFVGWFFFNNIVQNKHFPFRLSIFWYLTNIYAEALKDYFVWQETRTLGYLFLVVLPIFNITALRSCSIMYMKDHPQIY